MDVKEVIARPCRRELDEAAAGRRVWRIFDNTAEFAALGAFAAICSMASFLPQAIKMIREHDASSVSVRMYLITVLSFTLWTIYGVLLKVGRWSRPISCAWCCPA